MEPLAAGFLQFFKVSFLPSAPLLFYMGVAILIDFITGIAKAKLLRIARTSKGYRKTVSKFIQYGGALAIGVVLANIGEGPANDPTKVMIAYFNNALIIFIIYIEVTSVFENLYAMDQKSVFSKYFISPMLRILTWQIKNNPIIEQAKKLREQKDEKAEKPEPETK